MAKDDVKKEASNVETPSEPTPSGEKQPELIQVPKEEFEGLKSKVGELGGFIDESKEFINGASVVIATLANDPELRTGFQEALKKQGMVQAGPGTGQQPPQSSTPPTTNEPKPAATPAPDRRLDEVVTSQRGEIVTAFEKDNGIDRLPPEERKRARQEIEGYLNEFGWSVQTVSLANLRNSLEKAYVGTHANKLREEGKLEGFTEARANSAGVFGTISGGAPDTSGGREDLTAGQKKWAEKLGVDVEKAKKTYLSRDQEQLRVPQGEKTS